MDGSQIETLLAKAAAQATIASTKVLELLDFTTPGMKTSEETGRFLLELQFASLRLDSAKGNLQEIIELYRRSRPEPAVVTNEDLTRHCGCKTWPHTCETFKPEPAEPDHEPGVLTEENATRYPGPTQAIQERLKRFIEEGWLSGTVNPDTPDAQKTE